MSKKSSNDSKSESSASTPRVGRTIPLDESMLKRTLYDALHNPIPFPRLEKANEGETNLASEQVEPLFSHSVDQQAINDGQRKINGQFCRVDWMLIEVLRLLRVEMKKLPAAHQLDFERIDAILTKAYHTSAAIAEITPPGCEPTLTADPNWTVTETKVA
ncbi:MAG TPA: hypothetical protein VFM63_15860 [Pyrinomonadaceae bacterium]|nr:hypothetical protein [Pyrinomonadaceae bacterium]